MHPRQQIADLAGIEAKIRPAILAEGLQSSVELDLRRPQIGLGAHAGSQLNQSIGFLGAAREDPPRPVVLEAAPDKMNAVGEQGRSERITGITGVLFAVETESQWPIAIDAPAGGCSTELPGHDLRLTFLAMAGAFSPIL